MGKLSTCPASLSAMGTTPRSTHTLPGMDLEGESAPDSEWPPLPRSSRDMLPAGLCVCSELQTGDTQEFLWASLLGATLCLGRLPAPFCTGQRFFFEPCSRCPAFSTGLSRWQHLPC